ncbi:MAG: hypothetical protein U9R74_12425 [Pseudomonadota bacterium]|nr:hypothetical protein [Pseudomonadota bacterium]
MRKTFMGAGRLAFLLWAIVALAGCQTKKDIYEPVPPIRDVTAGSSLVLLKPLVISSGVSAAVFQNGRVVEPHAIRNDMPYCRLELGQAPGSDLNVEPQTIPVKYVAYDDRRVGDSDDQVSVTKITLGATDTNPFRRMNCLWPVPSGAANFMSAEDIAATLDGYFSIEEPG